MVNLYSTLRIDFAGARPVADSFVHLHNHTEYSMLDGAQKLKPMFAEVARQEMPAVAMSDHGNMFGAYEFHQVSKDKHCMVDIIPYQIG